MHRARQIATQLPACLPRLSSSAISRVRGTPHRGRRTASRLSDLAHRIARCILCLYREAVVAIGRILRCCASE